MVHGPEATGKSAVARVLIPRLAASAHVNAAQCITGRHLFERIVAAVATGLGRRDDVALRRCETLAQLAVALASMLGASGGPAATDARPRFVLVLDALDRQRDAPPTLVPALARLSETVRRPDRRQPLRPYRGRGGGGRLDADRRANRRRQMPCLTCVFIVTAPPASFLRTTASAHLHFPPYTKAEFVRILRLDPPAPVAGTSPGDTSDLWLRFCAAVHDALIRSASRTLPSLRRSCRALWPRFTAPVVAGTLTARDFSKLLVAARAHFQDESLLNPSIVSVRPVASPPPPSPTSAPPPPVTAELVGLLPVVARLLLLSAYLASHNATRHDLSLFSTHHHGRRRRRGGGIVGAGSARGTSRTKHRKIARKLLGAHAFVLERMMAIFEAVRGEWAPDGSSVGVAGLDGDVGMAMATLASLRLLVRVGSGDVTDRAGKWRINVSWEVVRGIGRSLGVEVEEWLME